MAYYHLFKGIMPSNHYDETTSLSLAIACDLAYEKNELKISNQVEIWGYKYEGLIDVVKKHDIDTQCFVMSNDENIVVVFCGSESLQDWLANFQVVYEPGPFDNTFVHGGFQDALFPAVIGITQLVNKASPKNKKIWITGHSLGGALCSIYAGMLIENGYDVFGIYTYASPRPGDGRFEASLNSKVVGPHYRIVNFGDVVPHLPPEPFYSHSGNRVILEKERKETSDESWLQQRFAAVEIFMSRTHNIFDIGDNHRLSGDDESYIPRLRDDLERSSS